MCVYVCMYIYIYIYVYVYVDMCIVSESLCERFDSGWLLDR